MLTITFNDEHKSCDSVEALGLLLDEFDQVPVFELWIKVMGGPSMSMLRNHDRAFLLYLRQMGDSGFTSRVAGTVSGTSPFRLANGQLDEYPLNWCVDLKQCYKAIAYFFVNEGAKPDWIQWHEH